MKRSYSLRTWSNTVRADGLPSLEACTAVYVALWKFDELDDEEWFVVDPNGEVLTACNFSYEHEDGESYCEAGDVEWIPEEGRIRIAACLGNVAPPLPPHVEG